MPIDKEKFEKKLKAIDSFVLKEDFTKGFKVLIDFVKSVVRNLNKRYTETINKIDIRLSQLKDGYTPVKGKDYFDGERGSQGVQGDTGEQGESIQGLNGADGSPDTPKLIRDKLEFLEADQRLDISAKGFKKKTY